MGCLQSSSLSRPNRTILQPKAQDKQNSKEKLLKKKQKTNSKKTSTNSKTNAKNQKNEKIKVNSTTPNNIITNPKGEVKKEHNSQQKYTTTTPNNTTIQLAQQSTPQKLVQTEASVNITAQSPIKEVDVKGTPKKEQNELSSRKSSEANKVELNDIIEKAKQKLKEEQPQNAKILFLQAREKCPQSILLANIYQYISNCSLLLQQYSDVIDFSLRAIEVYEKIDKEENSQFIAINWENIGLSQSSLGDHEKSIKSFQNSMDIKVQKNDNIDIGTLLIDIGEQYEMIKQYEEASEYFRFAKAKLSGECEESHPMMLKICQKLKFCENKTQILSKLKCFDEKLVNSEQKQPGMVNQV